MIVEMKKIYVVLEDKEIHAALDSLAEVGVLHVEHDTLPKGDRVERLRLEIARMEEVLNILTPLKGHTMQVPCEKWEQMFIDVLTAAERSKSLEEEVIDLESQFHRWQRWGDLNPSDIEVLKRQGLYVQLFRVPESRLAELPEGLTVERIFSSDGIVRIATFSPEHLKLDFDEVTPPRYSVGQLKGLIQQSKNEKQDFADFIRDAAQYCESFEDALNKLQMQLGYHEALCGRNIDGPLAVIKGFCPKDACAKVEEAAQHKQWGLIINDPAEDEQVPTLLRNPKWVELINPVLKLINVLPGYRELDISFAFLFFFSIFFGILIGDAGYGAIFALGTAFAQWKLGDKIVRKEPFYLMYILAGMTIAWGALTGTWFGQKWLHGLIMPLSPWMTENANIQNVCFLLGAIQLSFAHLWRGTLKFPHLSAFGEYGWAAWVWGMFFLVKQLIIEEPMPVFAPALMLLGAVLVIFCAAPSKNIFKTLGRGLGAFLGGFINSFTDVISYIRLFAVGLASVAIADAFNDIALGVGFSNVFAGLATAMILVVGHALNIVLGSMAILVHGVRLNVLEFSNHMNIQWTGFGYKPLKGTKALRH